jgi:hypothetical protein
MEANSKKNPLVFMFIMAVMYCLAFHEEKNKVRELEKKLEICRIKK